MTTPQRDEVPAWALAKAAEVLPCEWAERRRNGQSCDWFSEPHGVCPTCQCRPAVARLIAEERARVDEAKEAAFNGFIAGAKWWQATHGTPHATAFGSEVEEMEQEAQRRYPFAPKLFRVEIESLRAEISRHCAVERWAYERCRAVRTPLVKALLAAADGRWDEIPAGVLADEEGEP